MLRVSIVSFGIWLLVSACTQKVVCPAYQSAFIYDKDELRKKFSYFDEAGEPKLATVNKTKYLIAEPTTYRKKMRSMKTVEAKPINPVVPDSLLMGDSLAITGDLDAAARSVIDSTYIVDVPPADSIAAIEEDYVISVDREVRVLKYNFPDSLKYDAETGKYVREQPSYYIKEVGFNVEQGSYLWYLRDVLVLPDVRLSKLKADEQAAAEKKEKKGIKGFFSNLFKKKRKDTGESESEEKQVSPDLDEYNFDEFDDVPRDTTAQSAAPAPVKKKGLFGLFGKKNKPAKQKAQKPKKSDPEPAKKEEEEDDGF